MSRAYRIQIRESTCKVIRAEDHVSTHLELLNVLPCEQMAELLAAELEQRGFVRDEDTVRREQDGVSLTVDLSTGRVTVAAGTRRQVTVDAEQTGYAGDEKGEDARRVEAHLRQQLKKSLQAKADVHKATLQKEVTDKLEAALGDVRKELDQAVNRVTAEALKGKAAQLGTIKQVTEDPQSGSMTIILEV
jgi:hypothetical protein